MTLRTGTFPLAILVFEDRLVLKNNFNLGEAISLAILVFEDRLVLKINLGEAISPAILVFEDRLVFKNNNHSEHPGLMPLKRTHT